MRTGTLIAAAALIGLVDPLLVVVLLPVFLPGPGDFARRAISRPATRSPETPAGNL